MAGKIVISELDIDINALIKSTAEVKNAIDVIKKQQAELVKSGDGASNQFIQNAADLKTLSSAYNSNLKAIQESTQATVEQANREQILTLALDAEVTTIKQARDQNSLLNKLRNDANATTAEGQAEIAKLNAKLDENNAFIKENADQYLKQKINIGNYSESIKDALSNLNPFNGGIAGFTQRAQEAGGAGNLLKTSLGGVSQGIMGVVKSSLAFIATPLGAVLSAIVLVVGLLYEGFKKFQPVVDKVEQVFAGLSAVVTTIKNTFVALVSGTKSLGEAFSSLGGDMADAAKSAYDLKKAQQDLEDAMKEQEVQSAKNRAEINRLNIQAKDRTKSEEERIALLEKASKLEDTDFQQRKKNSDEALRQTYEEIRIAGSLTEAEFAELKKRNLAFKESYELKGTDSDELFDKLKGALLAQTDIENEFYSNQEKNINKQNKLEDDAQAKAEKAKADAIKAQEEAEARRKTALDNAVKLSQSELDLFLSSQGIKAKSLSESLKIAEVTYQKQLEINQKEYNASEKSEADKLELKKKNNDALNQLSQSQNDLVIANSKAELDLYISQNTSILEGKTLLNQSLIDLENKRLESILLDKINILEQENQTNQAVIDKKRETNQELTNEDIAFLTQKNQLESEFKIENANNQKILDEQLKAEKLAQRQADFEIELATSQTELDAKLLQNQANYDAELLQLQTELEKKKLTQEQFDKKAEDAKKMLKLNNDKDKADQLKSQIDLYIGLANAGQAFFGKNKALQSAVALADTFASANKAYYSQFFPIPTADSPVRGAIAAATATLTGLANVASINNIKFAGGGFVEATGPSHAQGGIPIEIGGQYFGEMQGGEGLAIMNKGAFSHFKAFNNTYGDSDVKGNYSSGFMASGGIITQGVQAKGVDTNTLVNGLIDAIAFLPKPQVAVTDINYQSQSYINVVGGANF